VVSNKGLQYADLGNTACPSAAQNKTNPGSIEGALPE
jgi:hypothetical protein